MKKTVILLLAILNFPLVAFAAAPSEMIANGKVIEFKFTDGSSVSGSVPEGWVIGFKNAERYILVPEKGPYSLDKTTDNYKYMIVTPSYKKLEMNDLCSNGVVRATHKWGSDSGNSISCDIREDKVYAENVQTDLNRAGKKFIRANLHSSDYYDLIAEDFINSLKYNPTPAEILAEQQ